MVFRAFLFLWGALFAQTAVTQVYTEEFEDFVQDINGNNVPLNWKLISGKSHIGSGPGLVREGNSSLKLSNDSDISGQVRIGRIQAGFPVQSADIPGYFNGYVRLFPMALSFDTCELTGWLTKWNDTVGKRDTIYRARILEQGFHGTFIFFSTPFQLIGEILQPDSCFLDLKVTRSSQPRYASTLYIDHLTLTKEPVGVRSENKVATAWTISYSEANGFTLIGDDQRELKQIAVYNLEGKLLLNQAASGHTFSLQMPPPEGWLLFQITDQFGTSTLTYLGNP